MGEIIDRVDEVSVLGGGDLMIHEEKHPLIANGASCHTFTIKRWF